VSCSVVPGITSAIAVPAAMNIPVTARGVSESFWVITGTTTEGQMSKDIQLAAQSTATVVILMGMKKIEAIMHCFAAHGRSNTPVAVIQNGTMANQRSVTGTVGNIASLTSDEDLGSPGIIVIGEVVRYARELSALISSTAVRNYE
jgi:uroporphyrin-III C-methyltransferase